MEHQGWQSNWKDQAFTGAVAKKIGIDRNGKKILTIVAVRLNIQNRVAISFITVEGSNREYIISLASPEQVTTVGPDLNELIWAIERAWRNKG